MHGREEKTGLGRVHHGAEERSSDAFTADGQERAAARESEHAETHCAEPEAHDEHGFGSYARVREIAGDNRRNAERDT